MSFLDYLLPRRGTGKRFRARSSEFDRSADPVIVPRSEHNVSRDNISESALKVLYRLNRAGFKAFLVGGGVRDILLGIEPKDFDIATDAHPEEIYELFRNSRLIGRRFRLAHVRFGREIIEVATFRAGHEGAAEGASTADTGRILRDNVYGDIDDDVWRRDFTVNALYYDISDYSIVDYVGGVEDIRQRRLRLIGDPDVRYREDPARLLRAIRFSAKLGLEIDPSTKAAFKDYGSLLGAIAPARLFDESLKLLHSGKGLESFTLMREHGLFAHMFPLAERSFESNEVAHRLVVEALRNTDERLASSKSVTPAFIFAAMLWGALNERQTDKKRQGMSAMDAFQAAADEVISRQVKSVAIPRRFTTVSRDIWAFQPRLEQRTRRRALKLLEHPRFRAAYDFLVLRACAGEPLSEVADWWTELQEADDDRQQQMLSELSETSRKRPRSRRRKPKRPRTD